MKPRRRGVELDRSTLADWVGNTSSLLQPLANAVREHVMTATKLHADDTPVPVLAPGQAGRSWRGCGPMSAMIVLPEMQRRLPCGSRTRRIARANIRGGTCRTSPALCRPTAMRAFIIFMREAAFRKPLAGRGYARARWRALVRYVDGGRIEIDNNSAERALRTVALGRKNYLFAGSDKGGERAASIYTLIGTAKLNGLDPELYLRRVLARIADHPINRIHEPLPWNLTATPTTLS